METSQLKTGRSMDAHLAAFRGWQAILIQSIENLGTRFPKDLRGIIEFIPDPPGTKFYISIDGPRSKSVEGLAPRRDVSVKLNLQTLQRWLLGQETQTPVFKVRGDWTLYERFFDCLAQAPKTQSYLSLRGIQ